jgi:hypothetical protein
MAFDKKISELPILIEPILSDVIPIVNDNITKKLSYGNLKDTIISDLPPGLGQSGLGWARYDDGVYTTGSSYTLTVSAAEQTLPNSGSVVINNHMHSTVEFYDTGSQTIQVENENDVYVQTVVLKAKTSNANGTYFRIQLDSVGDTPYERVGKDLFFPKGNDVWHEYYEVFQYYGDADFKQNGNRWKIQAFNHTVEIADVIYFIQRTQNHGGE